MDIDHRELLLSAWMRMSVQIRSNRLLGDMTFNEMLVLGRLLRAETTHRNAPTAAELCEETRMLKSEMNRLLSGMEKKGYILRTPSTVDRRKIELRIAPGAAALYEAEHERVLKYMDRIEKRMGADRMIQLTKLIDLATAAVDEEANQP